MGFFAARKQKQIEKQYQLATKNFQAATDVWNKEEEFIDQMIADVEECLTKNISDVFNEPNDYGFMLKGDEVAIAHLEGAAYIELVKAPSQYSAGYGGVSFPLFAGIRVNTGRIKGQRIPGAESMTHTDTGNAMITNTRIMFRGGTRTQEWKFDKMMAMSHLPGGITTFAMTTRGKPSGLGYGENVAALVQFKLELASAVALGTLSRFRSELQVEKDKHANEKPVPPVPLPSSS